MTDSSPSYPTPNTRPFATTGVPRPAIGYDQRCPSPSRVTESIKPVSGELPSWSGPRQASQPLCEETVVAEPVVLAALEETGTFGETGGLEEQAAATAPRQRAV